MNNTRHTPGPWVVRNMSDAMAEKFTVERLSNDGLRSVICRINDMEVCPEHGGTGSDANAHLIAAAPAMYADAKQLCELVRDFMNDNRLYDGQVIQAISNLETALSQAEGRDK